MAMFQLHRNCCNNLSYSMMTLELQSYPISILLQLRICCRERKRDRMGWAVMSTVTGQFHSLWITTFSSSLASSSRCQHLFYFLTFSLLSCHFRPLPLSPTATRTPPYTHTSLLTLGWTCSHLSHRSSSSPPPWWITCTFSSDHNVLWLEHGRCQGSD